MSSESSTAHINKGTPSSLESLQSLTNSALKAWHESETCPNTEKFCVQLRNLNLPEKLRLFSEYISIDVIHGACFTGAIRRYITLHHPTRESYSKTPNVLLRDVEQCIIAIHDSMKGRLHESEKDRLAYEVFIYERAMVEKRRKFNRKALILVDELRKIIDANEGLSREGLPHQLFTFPKSPLAYVDLQTGLLKSRLGEEPHITIGDEDGSEDMRKSILKACDDEFDPNKDDIMTASKVRYFVFMKILIQRDRNLLKPKPNHEEPWKKIDSIAIKIANNTPATNLGLVNLLNPTLKGETSGSGNVINEFAGAIIGVEQNIAKQDTNLIHTLLRETIGDLSLNSPLKTAANNGSNLSMFTGKTSRRYHTSREDKERYGFALECMSNGLPKIINTGNALADAVFGNSLRWEKISKPSPVDEKGNKLVADLVESVKSENEGKSIEGWLAKSTGHILKIDTALGSEFSEDTQTELMGQHKSVAAHVPVLNQYLSSYQPLPFLAEEKQKSGKKTKAKLRISKTTKVNRISMISKAIKDILQGLQTEGLLSDKDTPVMDSDKFNLLILPQRFKDKWTTKTLHYTLVFNSLHLERLATYYNVSRTLVETTALLSSYMRKLTNLLDKLGVLISMELLQALVTLSILREADREPNEDVANWLKVMITEIKEAGMDNPKQDIADGSWKHPSYERMFEDVNDALIQRSTSINGLIVHLENALFLVGNSTGQKVIANTPKNVSKLGPTEIIQELERLREGHLKNLTNEEHEFSPQKILATRLVSARLVQDFFESQ